MHRHNITIVGAGLVGTLLAALLARRGYAVELFEKRPDPRRVGFAGGRSINLALSERGMAGLRMAGLEQTVLDHAVMMRGRMVHERDGTTNLQRYGIDDSEVNQSVSRGTLNLTLLAAAERAGVTLHFDQALVAADFNHHRLTFADGAGTHRTHDASVVIGADGAGSALRAAMNRHAPLGERVEPLGHGYRELEIPPIQMGSDPISGAKPATGAAKDGVRLPFRGDAPGRGGDFPAKKHADPAFAIEANALHIWPRGQCMCIALPNAKGSFTVTLFLPHAGPHPSFASMRDSRSARAWFAADYADLLPLMPDFDADYASHPVGTLATLHLDRWHLGGQALLVGDAAHAMVPFHGQGMNAGFEDAAILAPMLADAGEDCAAAFARFEIQRKPDADAIAEMALENYVEMRDSVVEPDYLHKRALGAMLAERAPTHFMPRYRMVTFTRLPYAYCRERGRAQDTLLSQLLNGHADARSVDPDAAIATLRATLPPLPL